VGKDLPPLRGTPDRVARHQAAEASANPDPYRPPFLLDPATGSIGWSLFETLTPEPLTIFRQQLSDELLTLFD
jgi:hypothetical protein